VVKNIVGVDNLVTQRNKNILVANSPKEMHDYLLELYLKPHLREKLGKIAKRKIYEKASFNVVWDHILTRLCLE